MSSALDQVVDTITWHIAPPAPEPQPASDPPAGVGDDDIPVIATEDDLERFLWERFQVRISKHVCCPEKGHCSPWMAFVDAYFARHPVAIWKASRGFGGKSYQLSTLCAVEACTLRADVKLLGGSGEQAQRVLNYTEDIWALPSAPKVVTKATGRKTEFKWGNYVEALLASTRSVRGPHPQRLRVDEIDEMTLKILNASAGQTMSKGWVKSQTVYSSTHHYPAGTMTQKLQESADKGWPVFEWCYRANLESVGGWLPDTEIERKRTEVPAQMWQIEYEGQEPSAEGRAIDTEAVRRMFEPREGVTLEPEPVPGATYGTGADWARKVNHTVIITTRRDSKPRKWAWIRRGQRRPWPVMIGWFIEQVQKYGGTNRHDRTGLGDVVHQFAQFMGGLLSEDDGVIMVGRDRADLLSEYVLAIERGEVIVPWPDPSDDSEQARAIRVAKKEHEYATVEDLYGSKTQGKLPDTISGGALSWRAASGVVAAGATKPPEPSPEGPPTPLQSGMQRGRLSIWGARRLGQ